MIEIQLSSGNKALIDAEDYEKVRQYTWTENRKSDLKYARTNIWKESRRTTIYLHQVILGSEQWIDHKNGNGLDCRKSNLRFCNSRQNQYNRQKKHNGKSLYRGVSYRGNGIWRCRITVDGKRLFLGNYKTESEAALAYNEASKKYHGEFAYINVLEEAA